MERQADHNLENTRKKLDIGINILEDLTYCIKNEFRKPEI